MKSFLILVLFHFPFCSSWLLACGDERHVCDARKYGHRRAFLKNATIQVKADAGNLPGNSLFYDCNEYFKNTAEKASQLREHLIKKGVFSRATPRRAVNDTSEDVNSQRRNIASFAFVFFDQKGYPINEKPFHFSGDYEEGQLEDPFFFLSGRCHKVYNKEEDPSPWVGLPETAPKYKDLSLKPVITFNEDFKDAFPDCSSERSKGITSLARALDGFLEELYVAKVKKMPFFDYVYNRFETRALKQKICSKLLPLLKLRVLTLPGGREKFKHYYPKEKILTQNPSENAEGDFTHSEQYALFQAGQHLPLFLECCCTSLQTLFNRNDSAKSREVESYACLIYSYNNMCVRCAQSTIIDFVHTACEPLTTIIDKKLNASFGITDNKTRPMVFMAGYSNRYKSELYGKPPDDFELCMAPGERALTDPKDETCWDPVAQDRGYTFCSPEDSPQMIYHVYIGAKDSTASDGKIAAEEFQASVSPISSPTTDLLLSRDLLQPPSSFSTLSFENLEFNLTGEGV